MRHSLIIFLALYLLATNACVKPDDTLTIPESTEIPDAPFVNMPYEGDRFDNNCLFLSWEKVDFATEYVLQVANDSIFSLNGSLVFEEEVDSARDSYIVDLQDESTGYYFYRMRAKNGDIKGDWTTPIQFQVRLFSTEDCFSYTTPFTPRPLEPEHNAIISGDELTFKWTTSLNTTYYIINMWSLSDSINFVYKSGSITDTKHTIESPPLSGNYNWQIRAFNQFQEYSAWSDSRVVKVRK